MIFVSNKNHFAEKYAPFSLQKKEEPAQIMSRMFYRRKTAFKCVWGDFSIPHENRNRAWTCSGAISVFADGLYFVKFNLKISSQYSTK
jgi:hypothetical protein